MALQTIPGGMWIPDYQYWNGATSPATLTSFVIDAAGEKVAHIFQVPKTGTIQTVNIRLGTVSVGAATDLQLSFQTVSLTTGDPDGTCDQFRVVPNADLVSNTTVTSGIMSSDGTDTGALRSVTQGEWIAVVLEYKTFVTADSVNVNFTPTGTRQSYHHFGYPDLFTASWVKSSAAPMCSLKYDDGSYAYTPTAYPVVIGSTVVFNNTSTPDSIGLKFQFPAPCKIGGAWLGVDLDGDTDLILYSASGATTVASLDANVRFSTIGQTGFVRFTADQTLTANTAYILAVEPSTGTSLTLSFVDVAAAAELDQRPGGQNFHYATAKNPTTTADFTATTTRVPMIGLLVTAMDDGVQTGGGGGGGPLLGRRLIA